MFQTAAEITPAVTFHANNAYNSLEDSEVFSRKPISL